MEPPGGQRFVVKLRFKLLRHFCAKCQVITVNAVRIQRAIVLIPHFLQHFAARSINSELARFDRAARLTPRSIIRALDQEDELTLTEHYPAAKNSHVLMPLCCFH